MYCGHSEREDEGKCDLSEIGSHRKNNRKGARNVDYIIWESILWFQCYKRLFVVLQYL